MYTLLYLKGIANKDLRYSAGNSAHLLCASLDERGVWGRMDTHPHTHTYTHTHTHTHTHMYMAESLCCSPETVTILIIGYIPIQK